MTTVFYINRVVFFTKHKFPEWDLLLSSLRFFSENTFSSSKTFRLQLIVYYFVFCCPYITDFRSLKASPSYPITLWRKLSKMSTLKIRQNLALSVTFFSFYRFVLFLSISYKLRQCNVSRKNQLPNISLCLLRSF